MASLRSCFFLRASLPLVLASTVTGAVGCGAASAPAVDEARSDKLRVTTPAVSSDDAAQLAADNLRFALDLHAQIRAAEPGNFVFSQPSISIALAMLYAGAGSTTAAQMAQALHFSLPPERLHPAFDALDLALTTPPAGGGAFRVSVANSLWTQKGLTLVPAFLDTLAESYGAGMYLEDFMSDAEGARLAINGWVSDRTEHQIPELFPKMSIDGATRLVLANAIFFHGDWATPFQADSAQGTFHAPSGDVTVPMMHGDLNGWTWSTTGYSAAELDYVGGAMTMIVVMPDAGTFDAFEAGMTPESLTAILTADETIDWASASDVVIPRFKFATAPAIATVLKALGMIDAFAPTAADFSGIDGARDLYVQAVVHKAIIAVDEKGTTAAATGVSVGTASVPPTLVIDRPFLFFIRHNPTGALLFQGRVLDPSATD